MFWNLCSHYRHQMFCFHVEPFRHRFQIAPHNTLSFSVYYTHSGVQFLHVGHTVEWSFSVQYMHSGVESLCVNYMHRVQSLCVLHAKCVQFFHVVHPLYTQTTPTMMLKNILHSDTQSILHLFVWAHTCDRCVQSQMHASHQKPCNIQYCTSQYKLDVVVLLAIIIIAHNHIPS